MRGRLHWARSRVWRIRRPHRPALQLWLEFPVEPIHRHPRPLCDRHRCMFDRMLVGKDIEQVELIPTVFWTVLHQKVARNRCDAKSLLRKEGDGAGQMAGRGDQQKDAGPKSRLVSVAFS